MNLEQFLTILFARKKIAFITFASIVVVVTVVSLLLPKTYTASTTLVMSTKTTDPVTGMTVSAMLMPGYISTQVDIITSQAVGELVVENLGLEKNAEIQQQFAEDGGQGSLKSWLATLLLKGVDVRPSRESSVLDIAYNGRDPNFAALLANAFADAYLKKSLQLKIEPSKSAAEWFNGQIEVLKGNVAKAQEKLTGYQKEKGIVAVDERLDVENARLAELSSQLVSAQSQSYDTTSRQKQLGSTKSIEENPDIQSNPLIQNLKTQITQSEAKLNDLAQRLSKNHPLYLSAEAELSGLKSKLDTELKTAGTTMGSAAGISLRREAEIRDALAAQKAKVIEINQQRDQLKMLQQDLDNAQKTLDLSMQRFSQTKLEGDANQSDAVILNPATPPVKASSPRVFLNIALSMFLGVVVAIGVALISEMFDRRIRTIEDITELLGIPLVGIVENQHRAKSKFGMFKFRANA